MLRLCVRVACLVFVFSSLGCASRVATEPQAAGTPAASAPAGAPAASAPAPAAPAAQTSAPAAPLSLEQRAAAAPHLDTLGATLWVGGAVEYHAAVRQTYTAAKVALDAVLEEALDDPSWSAALEPMGNYSIQRPAIVLDVDETVLDNTPYQARLIREGRRYDTESWNEWCKERRAKALPGAVELTRYAESRRVGVFFITNRRKAVLQATCDNLRKEGFPIADRCENVMTRGGYPEWDTPDKGSRRAEVAKKWRIVQLYGDDLGDFISGNRVSPEERAKAVAPYETWWGKRWIVLPNPIYGSWSDALIDFDHERSEAEVLEKRLQALPN